MNDVREICERMLATPPPLRDSGEVLVTARRSAARRRNAGLAAGSALAVTAITVALTSQLTSAGGSALPVAAPPPATTAAPPPAAVPQELPPARAAYTHASRMRELLLGVVPPGLAAKDFPVNYDASFDPTAVLPNKTYPAPDSGLLSVAFAGILVSDAAGEGLLSADIMATAGPGPLAADCAPVPGAPAGTCEMVTVEGVRVQVTTWSDESGGHISAARRLDGGVLIVSAAQGMGSGESIAPLDGTRGGGSGKPPLASLPFTPEQLAALAANPAMLQFP